MNLKGYFDVQWLLRLTILISIASLGFAAFLLNNLDNIIHGTLYGYDLRFSYDWAVPVWSLERLMYVCLFLPMFLGGMALALDFLKSRSQVPLVTHVKDKSNVAKVQTVKENGMVISCPKCKKVFAKPLVMLDFAHGKTRLVNVCPYCNAMLGEANEKVSKKDVEIGFLNPEDKLKAER